MSTLSFAQIEKLWTDNGGNPVAAPVMAAIALAESGGRTDAANTKPPDASYGLWQINYYGSLAPGRTQAYGTPAQLVADPNRQAKAAIAISGNGSNFTPWTTYTSGAYKAPLAAAGSLGSIPALPTLGPQAAADSTGISGGTDNEGYLIDITMPGSIPNIKVPRAAIRKVLGATVLMAGGAVGLAGAFLLAGGKAPGPAGIVQGAVQARTGQRAARAQESVSETTPDELAERRAARARDRRGREAAGGYGSARAAGERAAASAGDF